MEPKAVEGAVYNKGRRPPSFFKGWRLGSVALFVAVTFFFTFALNLDHEAVTSTQFFSNRTATMVGVFLLVLVALIRAGNVAAVASFFGSILLAANLEHTFFRPYVNQHQTEILIFAVLLLFAALIVDAIAKRGRDVASKSRARPGGTTTEPKAIEGISTKRWVTILKDAARILIALIVSFGVLFLFSTAAIRSGDQFNNLFTAFQTPILVFLVSSICVLIFLAIRARWDSAVASKSLALPNAVQHTNTDVELK